MKKLRNLQGVVALTRAEQKQISGGISPDCPPGCRNLGEECWIHCECCPG